jgi:hypothetical protein
MQLQSVRASSLEEYSQRSNHFLRIDRMLDDRGSVVEGAFPKEEPALKRTPFGSQRSVRDSLAAGDTIV